MAKIEKEVVQDCLYDYGRLMWNCNFHAPEQIVDEFFAARGTTRFEVRQAAEEYGIIFTSATLTSDFDEVNDMPVEQEHPFIRFMKWMWR